MTKNNHLRVAVTGLGAVTRNIHLPAYKALAGKIEIVAGCDSELAARQFAKEKLGIREVFADPQKMIAEAAPDIVAICTPPVLHVEQSLMALEAGCHVFCEKPLAESMANADRLVIAAAESERMVVVNSQFPYMNIHREAKRRIGSPEFGKLLFLHASQTFIANDQTEAEWRGRLQRRVCFEFGIHVFELIRYFFDAEPEVVMAHMPRVRDGQNCDALNLISVEFADGRAASIILNRITKGAERYLDLRLEGEKASITTSIGGELKFEAGMHTSQRRPFVGFSVVKGGKAVLQTGSRSKLIATDPINPFASSTAFHFNNFIDAIRNGGTPPATAADNRKTLALVFAAYDSADRRQAVYLKDYLDELKLAA